jgi:hypothetical protein
MGGYLESAAAYHTRFEPDISRNKQFINILKIKFDGNLDLLTILPYPMCAVDCGVPFMNI